MKRRRRTILAAVCLAVITCIKVGWPRTQTVVELPERPANYALLPDGRVLWQAYNGAHWIKDPATGINEPATGLINGFAKDPQRSILPNEYINSVIGTDTGWIDQVRLGKPPVRIGEWTSEGGETEAALSPDGGQVAIIRSHDESDPFLAIDNLGILPFKLGKYQDAIVVMDVRTRRRRTIFSVAEGQDKFSELAWSPDGRSVTYLWGGTRLLRTAVSEL